MHACSSASLVICRKEAHSCFMRQRTVTQMRSLRCAVCGCCSTAAAHVVEHGLCLAALACYTLLQHFQSTEVLQFRLCALTRGLHTCQSHCMACFHVHRAWPLPHVDMAAYVPYETLLRSILAAHPFNMDRVARKVGCSSLQFLLLAVAVFWR